MGGHCFIASNRSGAENKEKEQKRAKAWDCFCTFRRHSCVLSRKGAAPLNLYDDHGGADPMLLVVHIDQCLHAVIREKLFPATF